MTGLALNTLYYVRVYTQQRDRMILSRNYTASSFWTAKPVPTGALAATSRERLLPEPVRHRLHPAAP